MRRLAWAFAGRLCDKYHNLMSWLIYFDNAGRIVLDEAVRFVITASLLIASRWSLFQNPLTLTAAGIKCRVVGVKISPNVFFIMFIQIIRMFNSCAVRIENSLTMGNCLASLGLPGYDEQLSQLTEFSIPTTMHTLHSAMACQSNSNTARAYISNREEPCFILFQICSKRRES